MMKEGYCPKCKGAEILKGKSYVCENCGNERPLKGK